MGFPQDVPRNSMTFDPLMRSSTYAFLFLFSSLSNCLAIEESTISAGSKEGKTQEVTFGKRIALIEREYLNEKKVSLHTISEIYDEGEYFSMLEAFASRPVIYRQLLNGFWNLTKFVINKGEVTLSYQYFDWNTVKLAILMAELDSSEGLEYLSEFVNAFENTKIKKASEPSPVLLRNVRDYPMFWIDLQKLSELFDTANKSGKKVRLEYLFTSVYNFENPEDKNLSEILPSFLPSDQELKDLHKDANKVIKSKGGKKLKDSKYDVLYFKLIYAPIQLDDDFDTQLHFKIDKPFSIKQFLNDFGYGPPSLIHGISDKVLLTEPEK
jgi:hypothetical protein